MRLWRNIAPKGSEKMYKNLEIELLKADVSRRELAKELGITYGTMGTKMRGTADFTRTECFKIKEFLNSELTIDELFKRS